MKAIYNRPEVAGDVIALVLSYGLLCSVVFENAYISHLCNAYTTVSTLEPHFRGR